MLKLRNLGLESSQYMNICPKNKCSLEKVHEPHFFKKSVFKIIEFLLTVDKSFKSRFAHELVIIDLVAVCFPGEKM